jgi:uracil-DNA glycosylase family 4
VRPGSGWPGDHASKSTPVAMSADDVRRLAATSPGIDHLTGRSTVCRACPRLVEWREQVAEDKRRAFADEVYWGRPVGGFGVHRPGLLIIGLAPAAHGGNRTGRIFTGDRSGDWLFAALHRAGVASQATSVSAGDGMRLQGVRVTAAVRCAPPANKPTVEERDACAGWLEREVGFVGGGLRAVLALGQFGWNASVSALTANGWDRPRPMPKFGHAVEARFPSAYDPIHSRRAHDNDVLLVGCYHPSQQNTFTGKLTEEMFDDALDIALAAADL